MLPISNITPTEVVKPAVKAELHKVIFEFMPNKYAYAVVILLDEDNKPLEMKQVEFTLEEMNDWGQDDTYVLTLALQKLGMQTQ